MRELHEWFHKNRREFPWRVDPTPYRVWVSEVMLQQTRANVVIPYFERWVEVFPDVVALASAPIERVIKMWEGLGYYSRARNLHKGAKEILERFGGEIPSNREDLESIVGLGPYTVGAILSFGFKKRAAAVDGNVLRVISRYRLIEENVCKTAVRRKIVGEVESLLDRDEPWITSEALIELGATVCSQKPRCEMCPLQKSCLGQSKAELLPIKDGEKETIHLKRAVVLIEVGGKILVKKGEAGKVMADLYEFPYFEMGNEKWAQKEIFQAVRETFQLEIELVERLKEVVHTFTRYKAHLCPIRVKGGSLRAIQGYQWIDRHLLQELPFSSGHRKIRDRL